MYYDLQVQKHDNTHNIVILYCKKEDKTYPFSIYTWHTLGKTLCHDRTALRISLPDQPFWLMTRTLCQRRWLRLSFDWAHIEIGIL